MPPFVRFSSLKMEDVGPWEGFDFEVAEYPAIERATKTAPDWMK